MKTIKLLDPELDMEYPLMQAIANRRTIRKWTDEEISLRDLSNLLWATCGQTKKAKGKAKSRRTGPSACNSQEIKVYVLMKNGVYVYDETEHQLICKVEKDIRKFVGTQKMMQSAPLGIVFAADLTKFKSPYLKGEEAQKFSAWIDTGYLSQNLYLYCSAASMSTVALGMIDRDKLRELMELSSHEKIVLTQVVGYQSI